MRSLTLFVWFAVTLVISFPLWAADDPKPGDFAGAMVFSGSEGSLLSIDIPEEVYRGLMQRDCGDIRIFDASENPVPFIIRERPKDVFTPPSEEVSFFLWDGGRENNLPANTDIEINTSGAVVRIKNQGSIPGRSPVYLVDLSRLNYKPSSLRIETENQGRNFNSLVSIHSSRDLSNWVSSDKRQILALFGRNVQDTLELPETGDTQYLLITIEGEAPPPVRMTVSFKPQEELVLYHERNIHGEKSKDGKKVNYHIDGFYPIESIEFILADADSIPVIIKNRYSSDEEWNIRARETIFRYNSAGSIVKSKPLEISTQAPYWELETTGELLFSSAPDCVIRWKPRELIFPARGKGPWTLSYGNAETFPLKAGELLPLSGREELEPAVFTGEKRYEKKEITTKGSFKFGKFLPWAFLGVAVITLSLLSLHIAKSMRKDNHNEKDET